MEASLLLSIILWCILALLALIASPRRSFLSLVAIGVAFYFAVKAKSANALWPLGASFLLWLMTSILSIRRHIVGITKRDVENAGALYSLPYLGLFGVLLLSTPEIGFLSLLTWLLLWYWFKETCRAPKRICLVIMNLPTLLLIGIYQTPLALVYAVPTLWLQKEIEEVGVKNGVNPDI